ncbi:MAG: MFS transporter [Acidobacteria bacterium]|nr:MFS transporter [Acidobacteriota bacterium]
MRRDAPAALSAAGFAAIFVFGMVAALLGAVLPVLASRLSFDMAQAGALFLVMNFAMLVAVLTTGPVLDRFGMGVPLALGPVLVGSALVMVMKAAVYGDLLPAVGVLGFGGGMLNAGANTLIADLHDDERSKAAALNLLGFFFGFGALLLPFASGWLLSRLGLDAILAGAAVLCGLSAAYASALRHRPPKTTHKLPLDEMPVMLRSPFVLLLGALLFLQSGNEFLLGGYLSTYLTTGLGAGMQQALMLQALLWGSIMVSRLALSRLLHRAEPHWVIALSAAVAALGCVWLALSPSPLAASGAVVLTGVSMAGVFTTALGIAGARYPQRSGTVIGLLLTLALCGGMLLPWLCGRGAATFGLRLVGWQPAAQFALIALLAVIVKSRPR